jgi:hypothetical protein
MAMAGFPHKGDPGAPPVVAPVAFLPPRVAGHSGFQRIGAPSASVPPPLPRTASMPRPLSRAESVPPPSQRVTARPGGAPFSRVRRSHPPPRKRREKRERPSQRLSSMQELSSKQFGARCSVPEPKLATLSISNDALRESLRPAVAASIGGGILQALVQPGWRSAECWLLARAPWQRSAISIALGVLLGLTIVAAVAPGLRPGPASIALGSSEASIASTPMAVAASPVSAPAHQGAEPPPALALKGPEPSAIADDLALARPQAVAAVEVARASVQKPAAQVRTSKQRKRGLARRATKPKSARSLSQLFREMRRSGSQRAAR